MSVTKHVESWPRRRFPSAGLVYAATDEAEAASPAPIHYGIGDIHGMRAALDRLLDMIEVDAEAQARPATLIFLGDLINRGPSSLQVLELLIEGPRRTGHHWIVLRGNHDQLFLDALGGKSSAAFDELMRKGGVETLASYGLRKKDISLGRARRAVPEQHLRFLEGLPYCYANDGYFFVHAGIDPDRPLEEQCEKRMMTIREPFLRKAHRLRCTVVHGHVPCVRGPMVAPGRIGVDTGAHMTGILTAVALCDEMPPRFLATLPK